MLPCTRTIVCLALVGPVWSDEVSLIQDVRSKLDIQRPRPSTTASGLLEVATKMLRHGVTTGVTVFVEDITLGIVGHTNCDIVTQRFTACDASDAPDPCVVGETECTPGVLAHIQHAHDVDQLSINASHAKFGEALVDLAEQHLDIKTLRDDEQQLSVNHKLCRSTEHQSFCVPKVDCDKQLYIYWKEWYDSEVILANHHLIFNTHFCLSDGNATDPDFRIGSVGYMVQWNTSHTVTIEKKEIYESEVIICRTYYTDLVTQGETCNAIQALLQAKSCVYHQEVIDVLHSFHQLWHTLITDYGFYTGSPYNNSNVVEGGEVHRVKLLEYDRVLEFTTLDVVQCLTENIHERNGHPCDEETGEADVVLTQCQERGRQTVTEHLEIIYPAPPATPEHCEDLQGGSRVLYPADDPNLVVCLPVGQPIPCVPEYELQEFADIVQFPFSPFSQINPACNPQPVCGFEAGHTGNRHLCVLTQER